MITGSVVANAALPDVWKKERKSLFLSPSFDYHSSRWHLHKDA